MQSLTKRIQPVLSGRLFVSDLDPHTRQALDIYSHFRASALIDLPPEQIKAEIEKMPESVRGLIRNKARRIYADKFLPIPANNGSVGVGLIGGRKMSLHDRIMAMSAPDNVVSHPLCMGGYSVAQQRAAEMAKEADELMADCEKVLTGVVDHHGSMRAFHLLEKIRKFKESTK